MRVRTDWTLLLTIVGMVSLGLIFVYSASSVIAGERYGEESYYFLARQGGAAVISFIVLIGLAKFDYRELNSMRIAFVCLGVVLAALILVYFLDSSHRWLRLGFINVQPSEFAKPALVLFLACFITERASDINGVHTVAPATMAMLLLAGAVVVADLGSAVVLMGTAAAVFYVGGLDRRYFRFAALVSLVLLAAAIGSKSYRLKRVIDYFDPEHKIVRHIDYDGWLTNYLEEAAVAGDTGYQAEQSRIAVGSGGWIGQGLMEGKQKLFYLPEAHTDFIYAVVGEELGLFGTSLILIGFLVILWRGFRLYWVALDGFGRNLAVGVTVAILLQAFINMSVVLDLAPTKGIPLPLISYGGSSLLSTMTLLGLLLSVSERARC